MAKRFMIVITIILIVLFSALISLLYVKSMADTKENLKQQAEALALQISSDEGTFISIHTNKARMNELSKSSDQTSQSDQSNQLKVGQTTFPEMLRDPNNQPDEFDLEALNSFKKFLENGDQPPYSRLVEQDGEKVLRYVQPLYMKQSCTTCHGGVKGEKDPFGFDKEGLKVNQLRGAITVSIPADKVIDEVKSNTITLIIGVVLIIFLLIISIYFTIKRTIVNPIQFIVQRFQRIAEGNLLDDDFKIKNNDEIGDLVTASDEMKGKLRDLIFRVQEHSELVSASSQELMAGAENTSSASKEIAISLDEMAKGAENQAQKTDAVSAKIEHISANFQQVAANTSHVKELSSRTEKDAEKGKGSIEDTIKQIHVVKQTVEKLSEVVKQFSERSKAIDKIVQAISGISEQTNLLALNAAIEASRAGEHGKGFAVVANEVRKLAEESSKSAKEITDILSEIQKDTDQVVKQMELGLAEVDKGEQIASIGGQSFESILASIKTVVREIHEVAQSTELIAADTDEIFNAVDEMRRLGQQFAAHSEEAASKVEQQDRAMDEIAQASRQLAQLSEQLQEAVQNFKV
ncbi:methyl-accepting chemotaxis protein [Microaerobacter geothermalis]|uniref:methyl-accepting chemotaxis protein n=1 Tax=Microaerobacter geothermalis TaxID=674972 RepID=UPI001F3C0080|nr:methyl-accepting chemotaxis protein [Microaerobacter geothermalis]MCF6093048.1 methyl-accepting chemotaxis protein [Microaerobacter geothermalis]